MENKKFRELLKQKTPKQIIALHTHLKIKLSDKQLDLCIKKKNA